MEQDNQHPLVAIKCLVFNHEPYLRDCLDGFVMQQTDFPFVAIVHDDASTDHSADIIREYAAKYPDIIKPIYETENQYSKQDGSLQRIMEEAVNATDAKYIAMCEGDDYWTDPYKLQKQVSFLETHPDYSLCFHRVKILIHQTGELKDDFITRDIVGESTIQDLITGNYIHTPSVVYRKNSTMVAKSERIGHCFPGDYILWILLGECGRIYKLGDTMAVYRYGSGIWSVGRTFSRDLATLMSFSKLSVVIENPDVKKLLQEKVSRLYGVLVREVSSQQEQILSIRTSHSYRLGRFLLSPFRILRRLLNK